MTTSSAAARCSMTREEFEHWILRTGRALTNPNAPIVPCRCSDVNCKGWRFDVRRLEREAAVASMLCKAR